MSYCMPLKELLSVFAIDSISEHEVKSITLDSRKATQGSVFFACKGHAVDGRDYVLQAQAAGAVAIVYEAFEANLPEGLTVPVFPVHGLSSMVGFAASAFYRDPSQELQVFGVTGTNGKTTCCYLLAQAFTALNVNESLSTGMIGTLGVGTVGVAGQSDLDSSGLTTPDVISVHAALAQFRDQGIAQVCMEVSSHALDQGRVNGVEFFCTLFTNLSRDHLDYHGDMVSYGLAKQRLFTDFHSELVIANAGDELGARLIDVAKADFIVQYGQGGDVFADDVELGSAGISAVIEGNGVEFDIATPLIGKVNVPNIEMLVATLLALSTSVEDIQRILSELAPAPGRMELLTGVEQPSVVIDYAHTPDALEKALLSVVEHCDQELWCVFGCGGDRDVGKRPLMGALAARYSDHVVITNDNPRTEDQAKIAADIEAGLTEQLEEKNGTDVTCETVLDRAQAIEMAINSAGPNDWVLIAGKGHETTQTIRGEVTLFSDREQVLRVLERNGHDAAEVSS